jgi:hypothetical protein
VYSTLLNCSEDEEDLVFFNEEFYASECHRSIACGVMVYSRCCVSRVFNLVFCKTIYYDISYSISIFYTVCVET